MCNNRLDSAWEEYLSTGIDPTGGDLEQEDDEPDEGDCPKAE